MKIAIDIGAGPGYNTIRLAEVYDLVIAIDLWQGKTPQTRIETFHDNTRQLRNVISLQGPGSFFNKAFPFKSVDLVHVGIKCERTRRLMHEAWKEIALEITHDLDQRFGAVSGLNDCGSCSDRSLQEA